MLNRSNELAYQAASAGGATQIELLVLVYSALAADIRAAGDSARKGDIAARCAASNHAHALLGHLENWDLGGDAQLSKELQPFYADLRSRLIALQANGSDHDFYHLAETILETRTTWKMLEDQLLRQYQQLPSEESVPDLPAESFFITGVVREWCV